MIKKYINDNFDKCIREHQNDEGERIGLPYPYTVPCVSGHFQEMYYWDTYFTNIGLILTGRLKQAKNNADDILYLVNRFGYMPNGNLTKYLKSSQPPFLSIMVRDIYEKTGDKKWLAAAAQTVAEEYSFWMTRRITPCGLNRYGANLEKPGCDGMEVNLRKRLGFEAPIATTELKREHFIANCESGWDLTPRFEFEAFNYVPVDLNSLLYALEKNMEFFCCETGVGESEIWKEKAEKRAELMRKYMLHENGCFYDYNFKKDKLSPIFSAASYFPLYVGMATSAEAEASKNSLPKIEKNFGVAACEKNNTRGVYQWDYPNAWACLQYTTVTGLASYGFLSDAERVAHKFISAVETSFRSTGNLWEKYNAEDGSINTRNEYTMPPMLGWTAGAYLYLEQFCKEKIKGYYPVF